MLHTVRVLELGSAAEELCSVELGRDADVLDLKLQVEKAIGVPGSRQRLLLAHGGRALQDAEDLIEALGDPEAAGAGEGRWAVSLAVLDPERAETLRRVEEGAVSLEELTEAQRGDRELVLAALLRAGTECSDARRRAAVAHVGARLWGDREVVMAAMRCQGQALAFASAELRGDREVVLAAVREDGLSLAHACECLQRDREVVLAAARRNGFVLEMLSEPLRGDREVAVAALGRTGIALQFVAEPLKRDWHVVAAAVRTDPDAMAHADASVREDPGFERFLTTNWHSVGDVVGEKALAGKQPLRPEGMWG